MIPAVPALVAGGRPTVAAPLLRDALLLVRAEAWHVTALMDGFKFDTSSVPDPPNTFTAVAGRLARTLYGRWAACAEPIPRTVASDGSTETAWPERVGIPLFVVEAVDEQRRVYLTESGFATARFPHRRVEVLRHGKYTTGLLGGRAARAVADMLGNVSIDLSSSSVEPWPLPTACATAYSLLARTLLALTVCVLDEEAPALPQEVMGIDFAKEMDEARLHLTVDAVHAF